MSFEAMNAERRAAGSRRRAEVVAARAAGSSWGQIAKALGVTRQRALAMWKRAVAFGEVPDGAVARRG